MSVILDKYIIQEETYLKAMILSRGIEFSEKAMQIAIQQRAKRQNLVYNMPLNATNIRPQELIIRNLNDGYSVVVSCVASNPYSNPVYLDVDNEDKLVAFIDNEKLKNIQIDYVKEPEYYSMKLTNGEWIKKYVSACGLDELNIIPWKGCAISKCCKFCGINNFIKKEELTAHQISKNKNVWDIVREEYLKNIEEAVTIALKSECYKEHAHIILIAGNLDNDNLDLETEIFVDIVKKIRPLTAEVSKEGIVVVITPPQNKKMILQLKKAGVEKVVFNIEAITKKGFKKYCPGKDDLGYEFFVDRLKYAVEIFGRGNVWTNLVFGLENKEATLNECVNFIKEGIVVSANVLHLDKGNSLDCNVPDIKSVIDFFYRLEKLNNQEEFKPFYCAKALRTSLSNEAHDIRIREIKK